MRLRISLTLSCLILTASCSAGGSNTSDFPPDVSIKASPVVSRISPATGAAGDPITIFGFGFSSAPTYNIVIIGGAAVTADSYNLVTPPTANEIESLTATVPAGASIGTDSVVVLVHETPSNADVLFTVTP